MELMMSLLVVLLSACKVYLPPCQPNEEAEPQTPVGVTVRRFETVNGFELADEDAGVDAGDEVEARRL